MFSSVYSVYCILVAIVLHGIGHMLAARAVGTKFRRLRLSRTGMRLITDEGGFASYDDELICALGGPAANACAALAVRALVWMFPSIAPGAEQFIPLSLSLGLLNLLPLRGFDGARILFCFLCAHHRRLPSLSPDRAARAVSLLSCLVLTLLWLLSVYLLLRRGSALSLFLFCLQLFRSLALENEESGGDFV